ncbi:MAG: hypothetical protein ACRDAX_09920 [Propionibacteriaceae bacterium]
MNEPLKVTYDWQQPVLMIAIPWVLMSIYSLFTHSIATIILATGCFILWLLFCVHVWLQTRAYLSFSDDDAMHVRRYFRMRTVRATDVATVKEIFNGRSPDLLLLTHGRRRIVVPSSRLQSGHSVVFAWLMQHNPDVDMDKGARRIFSKLEDKGLL